MDITADHIGYTKEVLNRSNKIKRNIDMLKSAISLNSEDPYLYYQLGKSYYLLKDYKTASLYFEKAVSKFLYCIKFPYEKVDGVTSFSAYYNIGVIYDVLGAKDKALKYYRMCGEYEPALKRIKAQLNIPRQYGKRIREDSQKFKDAPKIHLIFYIALSFLLSKNLIVSA